MNDWDSLTQQEKMQWMQFFLRNGFKDLSKMRQFYNEHRWRALDNVEYNEYPDTSFTKGKTGIGDIDVFSKTDLNNDTLTYPNGYSVVNPYPGQNTIIYNPKMNDAQDLRLDALHFMPQDEVYDALNSQYRYWASGDIYDDAREKYVRDSALLGREYMPIGMYMNNEADGKLRNHLIEGTHEYIMSKRYYPDKQQLRKDDAFLVPYIDNIREYLITGKRPANVLPGVDITPEGYQEGGSIDIKHPGRLTELKKRTGKTEAELWATGNPDYRKMITFARNSRQWHHKDDGGHLFATGNPLFDWDPDNPYHYRTADKGGFKDTVRKIAHRVNEYGNKPIDDVLDYDTYAARAIGSTLDRHEINNQARQFYEHEMGEKWPLFGTQEQINAKKAALEKARNNYKQQRYQKYLQETLQGDRITHNQIAAGAAVAGSGIQLIKHPIAQVIGTAMTLPDQIYDWAAAVDEPKYSNTAHVVTDYLPYIGKLIPGKLDDVIFNALNIGANVDDAVSTQGRDMFEFLNNSSEKKNTFANGGSIHIDPKNKGKLTETMRRTGKSKYELAHSKNPLTRKRAQFAINASHWNHKHALGDYLTLPDWDPSNPYHYHTASGEKVVITPEDWEKHKGQPYFQQVEDAVLAEQAAHPGPEYIINPQFSEDLRRVYKGNMGPKYQNYSSFSGNLPQGYSFTPEGLVQDKQGNLYVQKGFRQTPRFTYDENNPLVFPVLEGRNQGNVTFYPVNMEKTVKPALPVSRIMDINNERERAINNIQNYKYYKPWQLFDRFEGGFTVGNYDFDYYTDESERLRRELKNMFNRDVDVQTNKEYEWDNGYEIQLSPEEVNKVRSDVRKLFSSDELFNQWYPYPKGRSIPRKQAEKKAVIEVGPLQVGKIETFGNGGHLFQEAGWLDKIKPIEEVLAAKEEPVIVRDNTNVVRPIRITPEQQSQIATRNAFMARHNDAETEKQVAKDLNDQSNALKSAEFGTIGIPQSTGLQYAWRRFKNSKGSELLYPLPGVGEAMFGADVADKLYGGDYGGAAKDLALYGTMTYAPEISQGIKTTIKPYWNTNIAPKLEQAWMKITHPSYQKVYHGTPVDFDPTKFHSSTNEFGLHVAPQKQVAQHFTSGYVNGQFVPNGVIKEFYVPKPRHRTIDIHDNGLNLLSKDEIWQHGIGGEFDDVSSLMGGSDFNIKDKDILDRLGLIEGKDYLLSKSGKYTPELINQSYFTNAPNFRYFLSRKDIHANPREILGIKGDKLSLELDDLIQQRQDFNISPYTPMQKIPEDVRLSLQNINDKAGQLLYENGIPTIGYWNHSPIEGAQWNYIVTDPRAIKLPRHNFRINAYGGDLFSKGGHLFQGLGNSKLTFQNESPYLYNDKGVFLPEVEIVDYSTPLFTYDENGVPTASNKLKQEVSYWGTPQGMVQAAFNRADKKIKQQERAENYEKHGPIVGDVMNQGPMTQTLAGITNYVTDHTKRAFTHPWQTFKEDWPTLQYFIPGWGEGVIAHDVKEDVKKGDYLGAAIGAGLLAFPAAKNLKNGAKDIKGLVNPKNWSKRMWTDAQDLALYRGDAAEAQKLRDLHFKIKAPNTKAIDSNGNLLKMYHGQSYIDDTYLQRGQNPYSNSRLTTGSGFYNSSSKKVADSYHIDPGAKTYESYINLENPYIHDANNNHWQDLDYITENGDKIKISTDRLAENALYNGNDGVIIKNVFDIGPSGNIRYSNGIADDIISFYGGNKLTDAVTYNDNGVRIPLGERDNFSINDIRYALIPTIGLGLYGLQQGMNDQKEYGNGGQIIWDNMGQLSHPGRVTGIIGNHNGTPITMDHVKNDLVGIDNYGNTQYMTEGNNYYFPGQYVVEYPIKRQFGGLLGKSNFGNYALQAKLQGMRAGLPIMPFVQKDLAPYITSNANYEYFPYSQNYEVSEKPKKQSTGKSPKRSNADKMAFTRESFDNWYNTFIRHGHSHEDAVRMSRFFALQDSYESGYGNELSRMNNNFGGMNDVKEAKRQGVHYVPLKYKTPQDYYEAKYNDIAKKWSGVFLPETQSIKDFYNALMANQNYQYAPLSHNPKYLETLLGMKSAQDEINAYSQNYVPVTRQYGGVIKPFSYQPIPVVRYAEGGEMDDPVSVVEEPKQAAPAFDKQRIIDYFGKSMYNMANRHPDNFQYLPKFAQDTIMKYAPDANKLIIKNGQFGAGKKTPQEIADFFWAMENENHEGLNPDETYSRFRDPNGRDWDVGPGLVIGKAIEDKPFYTKDEIDLAVNKYYNDSMDKTRIDYDAKYGNGSFDKLDDASKMVIMDVIYRAGQNGVNPNTWPSLFQAAHDNDTINMLQQSRTRFKDGKGAQHYDNARVERIGEYLYPDVFEYNYRNSRDRNLEVKKKHLTIKK